MPGTLRPISSDDRLKDPRADCRLMAGMIFDAKPLSINETAARIHALEDMINLDEPTKS
jgi:hypothetical protein